MAEVIRIYEKKEVKFKVLDFEHIDGQDKGWYSFRADDNWNPAFDSGYDDLQKKSYERCLANPNFVGPFKHYDTRIDEIPTLIKCECGKEVEVWGNYMGASECPHCGRWHNTWGQLLKDPEYREAV